MLCEFVDGRVEVDERDLGENGGCKRESRGCGHDRALGQCEALMAFLMRQGYLYLAVIFRSETGSRNGCP
jgi:hypothetical protein